jgi:hypothetical protein
LFEKTVSTCILTHAMLCHTVSDISFFLFFYQNAPVSQDRSADTWSDMPHHSIVSTQVNHQPEVRDEYVLPMKRDHLYLEREPMVEHNIHRSGVSLYGRDPALSALRPSGMHGAGPLLTQVSLAYGFACILFSFQVVGLFSPKLLCGSYSS